MINTILKLMIISVFFIFGFYEVYLNEMSSEDRNPAALHKSFDITEFTGNSLIQAAKNQLLSGVSIQHAGKSVGIGLGHFIYLDQGKKKFACKQYQDVVLEFVAESHSGHDELPRMTVVGPCEFSTDISRILPLWIPFEKIVAEKPIDGDFEFNDSQKMSIRFMYLNDHWPHAWILKSVRLKNSDQQIEIAEKEIAQLLGQPLVIRW